MTETLLSFILKWLDLIDNPLVSHGEVSRFPQDQLRSLLSDGVLRETTQASEVKRGGVVLSVVRGEKGFFGTPEEDEYYEPVKVEEHEVTQYEIVGSRLAELIRSKNGIAGTVRPLGPRLFDLGEKKLPNGKQARAFFSLVNDDSNSLSALCSDLKSRPPNISVILLPREPAVSPSFKERLEKTGCVLLALDKHLQSNWSIPFDKILERALIEPQSNGMKKGSAYCLVIKEGKKKQKISKKKYDELALQKRQFHLYLDGIENECSFLDLKGKFKVSKLTPTERDMLIEVIQADKPLRPSSTQAGGKSLSGDSARKIFTKARSKVDVELKRNQFRSFKLRRSSDRHQHKYEFDPPSNLNYLVIIPL